MLKSKQHPLQGKLDFQGLSIAVENRKGSIRHWYDENSGEKGSTTMSYPYGYIKGTLGLDEDEVDVFVGPDKKSSRVFVVTQMRKDAFTKVDEQKVMLGFTTAKEAKKAYLKHYDDTRFFGSMKELSLEEFKAKLKSQKGKIIKNLYIKDNSANIHTMNKAFSELPSKKERNMDKGCSHTVDKDCDKCAATAVAKALTARMLSQAKTGKQKLEKLKLDEDPSLQIEDVSLLGPAVARALNVPRPFEPPVIASVHLRTPAQGVVITTPDFMTSCDSCGYTHKSLSTCPRCDQIRSMNYEACPIWKR